MCGDLAAQLAADRTAAARHQNGLAGDGPENFRHIHLNGFPSQQVLHRHVPHFVNGNFPVDQLVHAGQRFQVAAGLVADVQDVPLILRRGTGNGHENLPDLVFFHVDKDIFPAAHDGNTLQRAVPFAGVVIDDALHVQVGFLGADDVPQDHLPGRAGADDHGRLGAAADGTAAALQQNEPVGKPHADDEQKLDQRAEQIIGGRHPAEQQRDCHCVEYRRDTGRRQHPHQFGEAGIPPDAFVKVQRPERYQTKHRIDAHKADVTLKVSRINGRKFTVKTNPQRQKIRQIDGHDVIQHQYPCEQVSLSQPVHPPVKNPHCCYFPFTLCFRSLPKPF